MMRVHVRRSRFWMTTFPSLQLVLLIASVVTFSMTMTTTRITLFEVSAWIIRPDSSHFIGQRASSFQYLSPRRRAPCSSSSSSSIRKTTSPLQLYQKGGGNQRKPQKKDQQQQQQQHQNDFFFNTTGLYYMNDGGVDVDVVVSNVTIPASPLSSSSSSSSSSMEATSKGTFGDIMSPTIDDADLLFQDGLVTSETYSLEEIYGISNPLDRMAVTANGNLQRLFSSYYDAPVVVEMVHCTRQQQQQQTQTQRSANIDNDERGSADADADAAAAVWDRRVLLKIFGDQTFCTADSVIVVHSREVEDLVESGNVGIGQIFRHFNILPEFTLLTAGPTTNGGFWRNYTLESDLVTCSIREVFCKGVWELSPAAAAEQSE